MKPRSNKDRQILAMSGQLRPLTNTQKSWAFTHTIDNYALKYKKGNAVCLLCGHEWEAEEGRVTCPHCGAKVEVKATTQRVVREKSYFNIITAVKGFQVIRMFLMIVEFRKGMKANPGFVEIGQYWIDKFGHATVIGLQRTLGHYIDSFAFGSPLEIRRDNDAFRHIADQWVYPRIKVIDTIKRNGFKNSTHCIHPVKMFQQLLTNPHAETLMKADEIELLRYLTYHPNEVDKYWNSIKIAMRHGYKFEDVSMWFDYVRMLETMGRDLNSPTLLMPFDLKAAHDLYARKVNRKREEERREADRKKALEDQAKFQELKSRYFGLEMSDGEIILHTLDSIDQYYEVGRKIAICVGSAHYFNKSETLVLVAFKGTSQVATIEISLSDYSILQCRGYANGSCEYSKQIADIISKNTALIEARKRA